MRPCPRSVGRAEGSRHRNASTAEDLVRTARSRQSETYSVQASKASVCLPASLGHLGHHDSSSAPGPGRVDDGIEDWAALGEGRHECPGPPTMVCGLRQRWPAARTGPWNRASHLARARGAPVARPGVTGRRVAMRPGGTAPGARGAIGAGRLRAEFTFGDFGILANYALALILATLTDIENTIYMRQ